MEQKNNKIFNYTLLFICYEKGFHPLKKDLYGPLYKYQSQKPTGLVSLVIHERGYLKQRFLIIVCRYINSFIITVSFFQITKVFDNAILYWCYSPIRRTGICCCIKMNVLLRDHVAFQFTCKFFKKIFSKSPFIGEELICHHEKENEQDEFAIAVYRNVFVVGHIQAQFTRLHR